jgi:hypothetical protein
LIDLKTIDSKPILEPEPDLGKGVAGALRLAMSKGYIEKEENARPSASRFAHLQAKNYSIEDKTFLYVTINTSIIYILLIFSYHFEISLILLYC